MTTCLITGANRGIGLELARQYAARGESVVAICRTSSAELRKIGVRVIENVDVATDEGLALLANRLEGTPIDVLINCAGILERTSLGDLNVAAIRRQFEVNSLAPLRVTCTLLPNLGNGSKVGIVTSRMGSIADNTSGGSYGYRMSKAAVNMAGKSLAIDLAPRGIAVALLHPGYVRTDMTGRTGNLDADASAEGLISRMDHLSLETSGGFWHQSGEELPW